MQSMTSPIQPTDQQGHFCKKPSCWLYGFAVIGGCATLVAIAMIVLFGVAWHKLQPFITSGTTSSSYSFQFDTDNPPIDAAGNISLTEEQLKMLDLVGVDPEKVQGQDPAVLRACAEAAIGSERVAALESGDVEPTISDFLEVKTCVE